MQLLKDEFEVGMRLVSTMNVDELGPELVDVRGLGVHSVPMPADSLSADVYDRLVVPKIVACLFYRGTFFFFLNRIGLKW